jgi:hypothetical protein
MEAYSGGDYVFFDSGNPNDNMTKTRGVLGYVDVSDFQNIEGTPELQAAILGHMIAERSSPAYLGDWDLAHTQASIIESRIISEKYSNAHIKSDELADLNKWTDKPGEKLGCYPGTVTTYTFDYGTAAYTFVTGINSDRTKNVNLVRGVILTRNGTSTAYGAVANSVDTPPVQQKSDSTNTGGQK